MLHRHQITLAGAALATTIGIAMAAAGSVERAGSPVDVALVVAVSVMVTAGAHLLPAISRGLAGRVLWLACITLTIYSHAAFFTAAAHRAGGLRADAVQADTRTAALREQLGSITARPLAQVAAELAAATSRITAAQLQLSRCEHDTPTRCAARRAALTQAEQRPPALRIELAEAERAATLREQLTGAAHQFDQRRASAAADPVSAQLGDLTGLQPDTILTAMSVLGAVVVDLIGALLWSQSLSPMETATHAQTARHEHQLTTTEATAAGDRPHRSAAWAAPERTTHPGATAAHPAADRHAAEASGGLRHRLPAALRAVLAGASGRTETAAAKMAQAAGWMPDETGRIGATPVPSSPDPGLDRRRSAPPEDTYSAGPPIAGDGGNIRAIAAAATRAAREIRSMSR